MLALLFDISIGQFTQLELIHRVRIKTAP